MSAGLGGAVKPEQALQATFSAVNLEASTPSDPQQAGAQAHPALSNVGSVNFQTGADGLARVAFTPPAPGLYLLTVNGYGASSQALVWVGGAGSGNWPVLPDGDLLLELVGQGYGVFIPNPFAGTSQALVQFGAGDAQALSISGGGVVVPLPETKPGAASEPVAVTLVGKTPDGTVRVLKGSIDLPRQTALQVEIDAEPRQPLPGEPLALRLQALDAQGNPVQAEFSLGLSDGVTPVQDSADDLEQNVYWNGSLVTDSSGMAYATVRLPERVQAWTVVARAVTQDGQTAAASRTVRPYSGDLQMLPQLPGALAAGDHATIPLMLFNNTAKEQAFNVSLNAVGFTLDADSPQSQSVTIPAGGQAPVAWTGTVGETDLATLTFLSGDYSRLVYVPVQREADAQAFAASGVLTEEGQRHEVIALPPGVAQASGSLRVELSPSLAALVTGGLQNLPGPSTGLTEDALLHFAPWAAAFQALQALGLKTDDLQARLDWDAVQALQQLAEQQNPDGGWGAWQGLTSDPWIGGEALYALAQAKQSGATVDAGMYAQALRSVRSSLAVPDAGTSPAELDHLALSLYALTVSGVPEQTTADQLYEFREDLSPAGMAFLALALPPDDKRSRVLVDGLEQAVQSNGADVFWHGGSGSTTLNTAVALYALGKLDPASPLLPDVVRSLLTRRGPDGGWSTSRENLWAWLALTQVMQGTADVRSTFAYSAELDGAPVAQAGSSGENSGQPSTAAVALDQVNPQGSLLIVQRGTGDGRLYYQAGVRLYRPAETIEPVDRGIAVERQYSLAGQDCSGGCPALTRLSPGDPKPVIVRLRLTVSKDVGKLAVEDFLPAGADFQGMDPAQQQAVVGLFGQPSVSNGRVRWMGVSVPAGSYELVYRLAPRRPGTYHVLPAQVFAYDDPEMSGSSAGAIIDIKN